ncbi:5-histidylcysteine sulfoxide synthase [Comamonas flocculans]|uniref:5-histidylcysteine sulfoxide synthase n=1 Tax=Comamonas flocculans TaxID=2597701 RepID=A0A5B8S0G4_9BURK|nr:5-histidylcysteine sulfoxide synthase [Comamonas flocculans]QEA14125.1 5-histidylcysteine sulfoxide synthase [Comamonas flocculans]
MNRTDTAVLQTPPRPVSLPRRLALDAGDPQAFRRALRSYFSETFDCTESLFRTLDCDEAWYQRPITLRHPLIFYYGHVATFFVNKLMLTRMIGERLDPHLESIFAVGVDEMSWDDLDDAHYDWPAVERVQHYRDRVRSLVLELIDHAPLALPMDWENPWWAIVMGVEHERIHIETSSVLIRQQRLEWVRSRPEWPACPDSSPAPQNSLVEVPAGHVRLGKPFDSPRYGWDNEYGHHEADIPAFEAARLLVSNGEFLDFVKAGGYGNDAFWDEEGLRWRDFAQAEHPSFWVRKGAQWHLRLMTQEVPMPWNWPAEVNCLEARAFCRWKSQESGLTVRLPTEDEWQRILATSDWQLNEELPANANLYLEHWASPCPVDRFEQGAFCDVVGNVWQWTETPTYPFEGFKTHPIYDDFTTPTFDERHNLIKGGSWVSTGNEAEPDSRYAFRRHFFQHAGLRYVVSDAPIVSEASHYETDELVTQYMEFHYGAEYWDTANFPKALARLAIAAMGEGPRRSAMDLGCAVGRSVFELARHFEQVVGVDFSARFIDQGVALARGDTVRYTVTDEGELVEYKAAKLADLGLADTAARVQFWQGDACNLQPRFTGYDLILAANLIDRLYDPARFLHMVHERLNAGGLLVLASPYTWLAEHTPRDKWLGGFKKDGESWRTLDALKALLGAHFEMAGAPREVPFVIRETRHKFQHSLSEVTLWKRVR